MTIEVRYDRRADQTEAFAVLAEGWNDMVIDGVSPDGVGSPGFGPASEVLYAVSPDGDIVGVLAFVQHPGKTVLQLAYVEPSSRRQGVFKALVNDLKTRSYATCSARLSIEVPVGGQAALIALRHLGFTDVSVTMEIKAG